MVRCIVLREILQSKFDLMVDYNYDPPIKYEVLYEKLKGNMEKIKTE